ncbi:putative nuclease HARBI1 [Papaver somniferum]|uniref:putative nuclease HARBI1 n=1 Tax=Papaver somniferum TaxID=3469 RepID=UPI000E7005D2|nr:putative nuclease HARBI1 [Papaver somniferum]
MKWSHTRIKIPRNREAGDILLWNDYFSDNPTYPANIFRRRFRMRRELFNRILADVVSRNPYFAQKRDACGILGLSPHQKVTAAIRMLAYGCAADAIDEYLRIGETTVLEATRRFCKTIVVLYGKEYLRSPTAGDVELLLKENKDRGFTGMLGSVDCMHWKWDRCPSAESGVYTAYKGSESIVLEAVVSHDLWFWHAFFGMPGSCNDINVMNRSYIFRKLINGKTPPVNFEVNGHAYDMGYYLGDGIYPQIATIVMAIKQPDTPKKYKFSSMQEGARKDVERGFGVLQQQFAIVKQPARMWNPDVLAYIMKTVIILHNMIVEDECLPGDWPHEYDSRSRSAPVNISRVGTEELSRMRAAHRRHAIHNKETHFRLRQDLIEHIWSNFGDNY